MSCYLCEDWDISFLVQYAIDNKLLNRIDALKDCEAQELGQRLLNINAAAVDIRYGTDGSEGDFIQMTNPPLFKFDKNALIAEATPIQTIKTAQHFKYQCLNYGKFDGSSIERMILYIIDHASQKLPEYNGAKWGSPPKPKIVKQIISKL